MVTWTYELQLFFLTEYHKERVLWDYNHTHRKDKQKIKEAWIRVSEILKIPVLELKSKKQSLMATFRGHLRKKKSLMRSGASTDVYKPVWFAYEFMESFLGPLYGCIPALEKQNCKVELITAKGKDNEDVQQNISKTAEKPKLSSLRPTKTTGSLQKRHCPAKSKGKPTKRAVNGSEKDFNKTHNVTSNKAGDKEEDECDLYGKMLAKKLRKLPEHEREMFMYEIDGMFISRLNRDNPVKTEVTYTITEAEESTIFSVGHESSGFPN